MHAENKDIKGYLSKGTGTIEINKRMARQSLPTQKVCFPVVGTLRGADSLLVAQVSIITLPLLAALVQILNLGLLSFAEQGGFLNARKV